MRFFRDLTLVLFVLAGTIGMSQVPRFVQEYEQRLGGALQEARRQLAEFERLATREGLTLDAFAQALGTNQASAVAGLGRSIQAQAARTHALAAQAEALERAGRFRKPLLLLRHHDRDLLAATWAKYALTLTLDPGFAALGALFGLVVNGLLWAVLGPRRRRQPA